MHIDTKELQDSAWLGWQEDLLGIMQEIKIRPYY